jgi:hypothetical protein
MKIREKRIPTIIGLFLLTASLAASVFLVNKAQIFFLRAEPELTPSAVKITNITANSFTVSWITIQETNGFIKVDKEGQKELVFADDRDQISGQIGQYSTHYVTAKNLTAQSRYLVKLGSAGKIFDDNGKPYEVTTGPVISQPAPAADPAYGTVQTAEGRPVVGAIIYLNLANTTPQSVLVRTSGNWLITLSSARTADLTNYASYDKQASLEEVFVQAGKEGTATGVFTTGADSPAPTLVLGKNYDLRTQEIKPSISPAEELLPTPSPMAKTYSGFAAETPLEPAQPTPTLAPSQIQITVSYPREGEEIFTAKPEFSGTGPVNKILSISLNSQSYFGQAVTDKQGSWSWSPPDNLDPGTHKLVISYQDKSGQTKVVQRQFTVATALAAGGEEELPSFTSTPSATLTPNPTPTLPPRTTQPSTDGGIPRSGTLTPTFFVSIMGVALFLGGIFARNFLIINCKL